MAKSKLERAERLLRVQAELLKLEEKKAQDLKEAKVRLEEAETGALAALETFAPSPRLTAITSDRAAALRDHIGKKGSEIAKHSEKLLEQAVAKRLAERVVKTRWIEAEREKEDAVLAEMTEATLIRSRFK